MEGDVGGAIEEEEDEEEEEEEEEDVIGWVAGVISVAMHVTKLMMYVCRCRCNV